MGHQPFPTQRLKRLWSSQRAACPSRGLLLVQGGPRARLNSSLLLLGCHTQQKTKGNPDSNLSDDPFAITSQLPSPLLHWEKRLQLSPERQPYQLLHGGEQLTVQTSHGFAPGQVHIPGDTAAGTMWSGCRAGGDFRTFLFLRFFFFSPSAQTGCECTESQITLCLALWRARAPKPSCSQPGKTH